jgi:DNA ligase-1
MSILNILEQVANDSSKNNKISLLTANKDNATLKTVCRLAYDPTINFYLKQIPKAVKYDGTVSLDVALHRMERDLASRTYTGNEAREFLKINLESLTEEDATVLARVIDRDLRAGFSDSTVNKVWKGLIPEYPYMRCSLPKAVKLPTLSWKDGVYSQLKADGMFANVNLDADGEVTITSRSGTVFPLTHFGPLIAETKELFEKGYQQHGELLIKRNGVVLARQIGNGILNKVAQGGALEVTDVITFLVWDSIPLSSVKSKGTYDLPYSKRYARLLKLTSAENKQVFLDRIKAGVSTIDLIPTRIVHNMEEAMVHYREMLAEGLEGTIIKCGNGGWKDGTSKFQVKMKLEITVDLRIIALTPGKGKNADTFGSVTCQSLEGLLEVNVSGFSDEMRLWIFNNFGTLRDTIMAVKGNSIMPPSGNNEKYSLFLPRFEEFRNDKSVADTMAQVQEQFDNAVK